MLTDEEILETVLEGAGDLEFASKELIRKANANGGEDNITAVLLKVDEVPAEPDVDAAGPSPSPRNLAGAKTAEMPAVPDPNDREALGRANTLEMEARSMPSKPPAKKKGGRKSAPPPKKKNK
jgi:serine/threonine protein phosphatase PrpC